MVESIYFLKPAWCGDHLAGLWPEQGLQPVMKAIAFRRWLVTCDQFPVPAEQCLRGHDGCHFRQHLSSEQPGFDCQTAALIVGEAKPSAAKLSTKDSVFPRKYSIACCCF